MLTLSEEVVIWEKVVLLLSNPLHIGFRLLQHFEEGLCKAGTIGLHMLCVTIKHS